MLAHLRIASTCKRRFDVKFSAAETSSSLAAGLDCIKMKGNYSNKNLCVETSKLCITSNRPQRTKKFTHLLFSLSEN